MANFLNEYNVITPILIITILVPFIAGAFTRIRKASVWYYLVSFLKLLEFGVSIFLSFYLTRLLFFEKKYVFAENIKKSIESYLDNSIGPEIKVYIIVTPIIFLVISLILKVIFYKFKSETLDSVAEKLTGFLETLWTPIKVLFKLVISIPKAVLNAFIICLLLNVVSIYFPSPIISDQLDQSGLYTFVNQNAIEPILNSRYIRKLPVVFKREVPSFEMSEVGNENGISLPGQTKRGIRIIWYFNGVTLEEAVKSNDEIDNFAKSLVSDEPNSRKKARKIYKWIGRNIKYNYKKAERINNKVDDSPSGAIEAFSTKKGICFDMSALYAAMCRAVGLKVRLIVGTAYNGVCWGEHSWNQVFLPDENKWVNVDTTFSIGGNYFDRKNFDDDHINSKIAGEWQ